MIKLVVPELDEDEIQAVIEVMNSGYLSQGPKVAEFEQRIAEYVRTKYALATNSGTSALFLALAALNLKPDDEVLVPDFTFPATANVVVQLGAIPVLVDVDPVTFNIKITDLTSKITSNTRVIMPVHLFGLPVDMDPIIKLARKHKLTIVEDAACAIGAFYQDQPCGSVGTLGCFSFHPRKIITTGEGGMVVTNNGELAQNIAQLRNHGIVRWGQHLAFEQPGYNFRMSDINAAIGLAQMKKLDTIIQRRRMLAQQLSQRLQEVEGIQLPQETSCGLHIYQSFVILLSDGINRNNLVAYLRNVGVEATLGTYALHTQPFYVRRYGYKPGDLPGSYLAFTRSLALPLYPRMSEREIDAIVDALNTGLKMVC